VISGPSQNERALKLADALGIAEIGPVAGFERGRAFKHGRCRDVDWIESSTEGGENARIVSTM
jgi:hypothetical protein